MDVSSISSMAYLDGPEMVLMIVTLAGVLLGLSATICNILGLIQAARMGTSARTRLILHAVGIPIYPLGGVMGLIWFFKWRKSVDV
jgi:hypothetical protein